MPDGITREVSLCPAYHKSSPNISIHDAEWVFAVQRGKVKVEWAFSTGWYIRETRESPPNPAMARIGSTYDTIRAPNGLGSISYHSPKPLYEGQSLSSDKYEVTGGDCYSDSGYIASGDLFDEAVANPKAIWLSLEKKLEDIEQKIEIEVKNERNFS